jgi:hypothetical protein
MKIILSVDHLDENQKIHAGYAHDTLDVNTLARKIMMDLGPTLNDEGGLFGGTFFFRVDFNLSPNGAMMTNSFHAHQENGQLMIGTTEFKGKYMEFDGIRIAIDHSAARRK